MPRMISVTFIEDCLDATTVKEIRIDPPLDEELMRRMAEDARLQFFPNFPRPYFRIERGGCYVIQGIIGKEKFRVTFSPSRPPDMEAMLYRTIESSQNQHGDTGDV